MQRTISMRTDFAMAGMAAVTAAAVVAAPLVPVTVASSPPAVVREVRLAAAVPPGGLITSILHNQTVYCSIICPLIAQAGVTAATTALQAPGTFLAALSAGDVLKAIGAAAASVTGPTETAAQKAIDADAEIPAQRALNAFEVGVVGLLNVLPAIQDGLPGIAAALQKARQDTFDALNLPFTPNPTPTVMPHGVFQVAVVGAINVAAAVIFPAFNDFLSGIFQVPDAVARELAASGNPVSALAAGIRTAAGLAAAAGKVVAQAVATAVDDVRAAAAGQPASTSRSLPKPDPGTTATMTSATTSTTTSKASKALTAPTPKTVAVTTPKAVTATASQRDDAPTAKSDSTKSDSTKPDSTTSDTDKPDTTATSATSATAPSTSTPSTSTPSTGTKPARPNPVQDAASNLRNAVHNLVKNLTPKPPHQTAAKDGHGAGAHRK
ncbi:uncharacterized protein RMCC_3975 [Mycolicibacterium canariasense]|uniref:Uncharacterized protein n=1 Tax=Mycolicibacterium canariasense TaxID=228230 RepID=A0A124E2J4_MYCCR|nr:hypothetical protein [Mycolicibacterium canariasense]MCV7211584.1 hypothetical protein [Mycolicibacterium canariasense]ORV00384.1 hypothetical protein AWB94_26950 [Mycolicibacterium canariasense]GAS97009.1 uncharacterized protein RMCC_3975 [Mycolicibacterium canariasense]